MFVVFDLETTGFVPSTDDIIQFSYICFDSNNIAYDSGCLYFYYEGMSWSEEAYAVHHISQEFLKNYADDFRKNLIRMWTILSGANVVGHNAKKFDSVFASRWLQRMGLNGLMFGSINDTMLAFRPLTHTQQIKLTTLSSKCGLTPESINNAIRMWFGTVDELSAHDARYDVAATAMLTLIGLSRGYMSFDAEHKVSYEDVNPDALSTVPADTVLIRLVEADGTERAHVFNDNHKGNSLEFPIKLNYVAMNRYENEGYTLIIGNPDTFEVPGAGVTLVCDRDYSLLEYTKTLIKKGV